MSCGTEIDDGMRYSHTDMYGEDQYRFVRPIKCGDSGTYGTELCEECEKDFTERYPQGWSYYPGDRCTHGVYVGGVGVDHMCHNCEMGLTYWWQDPAYTAMVSINGAAPIKLTSMVGEWRIGNRTSESLARVWGIIAERLALITEETSHDVATFEFYSIAIDQGYWSDEPQAMPIGMKGEPA